MSTKTNNDNAFWGCVGLVLASIISGVFLLIAARVIVIGGNTNSLSSQDAAQSTTIAMFAITPNVIGQSAEAMNTVSLLSPTPFYTNAPLFTNIPIPISMPSSTPIPPPTETATPIPIVEPTITPIPKLERLEIADAHASSILDPVTHWAPTGVFDNDPNNAWASAKGDQQGSWIELTLNEPRIIVGMGFSADGPSGTASHIQDATLLFSDGSSQKIHLKNVGGWQFVDISPVTTTKVRVTVDSFYKGPNINCIVVNGIELSGR